MTSTIDLPSSTVSKNPRVRPPTPSRPKWLDDIQKRNPNTPTSTVPPIPLELSGQPQKQALIYGYTVDDTTSAKLNLSCSYEAVIEFIKSANELGLDQYFSLFSCFADDDLHLFYFAIKYPWHDDIWTHAEQLRIPSEDILEKLSEKMQLKPHWFGYEDLTDGSQIQHPELFTTMLKALLMKTLSGFLGSQAKVLCSACFSFNSDVTTRTFGE